MEYKEKRESRVNISPYSMKCRQKTHEEFSIVNVQTLLAENPSKVAFKPNLARPMGEKKSSLDQAISAGIILGGLWIWIFNPHLASKPKKKAKKRPASGFSQNSNCYRNMGSLSQNPLPPANFQSSTEFCSYFFLFGEEQNWAMMLFFLHPLFFFTSYTMGFFRAGKSMLLCKRLQKFSWSKFEFGLFLLRMRAVLRGRS